MGEGTLKGRRGGRGEEGGVEHKGHDQLDEGTTRRGGTRQSRCQPALQVSQRSSVSSSKGMLQSSCTTAAVWSVLYVRGEREDA